VRCYIVRPVVSARRWNELVSASHVTASALPRQARQAAAVAPREVAARVGVQQSVVSANEGGGREPSLATLSSPVEVCGVTLEVHLGDEVPTRGRPGAIGPIGRRLTRRRDAVLATAARHGMTDLRVFGSVARGQDTDDSDLDLLVQVPEGTGLLALGRFTQELEDLLHVPVDVVPDDSVKPRVRDSIRGDFVPL
jgi:predicted nucleotidyltransferase